MRRWTNQALFVLLGLGFVTGWTAFFYANAPSRWSLIVHATSGYAIIALTPWKSVMVASGVQRRRPGWWASLILTVLVTGSVVSGILHSSGLLIAVGPISAMEVHVGAALVAIPFVIWHVMARRIPVRAVDFSRRSLLRAGTFLAGAGLTYGATEGVVRVLNLAGARRSLSGSFEIGSLESTQLPVTQWMFDRDPAIDPSAWRLVIRTASATRAWTYDELSRFNDRIRATLDCTGGFFSTQDWSGVWLRRLLAGEVSGASIHVRSMTGYDRRFPIEAAEGLLLATRLGDVPLESGHGFPVRLVAPDHRGYWWVKWVTEITIDELPVWWQLPFPIQ